MELKQPIKVGFVPGIILLIVPYGIETLWPNIRQIIGALLIVPYGIETAFGMVEIAYLLSSFNRTLWN